MSAFELDFSLYSLLLGLALVQVLSGLVRTIQSPDRVKLGRLTPILGLWVMVDLTSFWTIAWSVRNATPPRFLALFYGVLVMGLYYFAASLVFPTHPEDYPHLDRHYFRYRRSIIGCMIACNLLAWSGQALLGINPAPHVGDLIGMVVWLAIAVSLMFVRAAVVSLALMASVILLYPVSAILSVAGL
jgi:hypothetical protein